MWEIADMLKISKSIKLLVQMKKNPNPQIIKELLLYRIM